VGKGLHVVLHFKKRAAGLAAIDDRIERISLLTFRIDTLEPRFVWHNHLYEENLVLRKDIITVRYCSTIRFPSGCNAAAACCLVAVSGHCNPYET
jgi:hypothetical protein